MKLAEFKVVFSCALVISLGFIYQPTSSLSLSERLLANDSFENSGSDNPNEIAEIHAGIEEGLDPTLFSAAPAAGGACSDARFGLTNEGYPIASTLQNGKYYYALPAQDESGVVWAESYGPDYVSKAALFDEIPRSAQQELRTLLKGLEQCTQEKLHKKNIMLSESLIIGTFS